jgi:hypothetical protein
MQAIKTDVVRVMTTIAIGVAQNLLPMDAEQGASALLKNE